MSTKFHIPEKVDGINRLLTTRKWEKAAIVWAYVHSSENQAHANSSMMGKPYSPESFAALGLIGLRSKDTVRAYWQRWQHAIDKGKATPVKPGDDVTIPGEVWVSADTDNRKGANRHVSRSQIANAIASDPSLVAEVIKADPSVAEAAEVALDEQRVEYANNAALEAIQRGGKVTTCPEKPKAKDTWPEVQAEVARMEPIGNALEYIEAIEACITDIKANGMPQGKECPALRELVQRLGKAQSDLVPFLVDVIDEEVSK